jgi:hypothetical protein
MGNCRLRNEKQTWLVPVCVFVCVLGLGVPGQGTVFGADTEIGFVRTGSDTAVLTRDFRSDTHRLSEGASLRVYDRIETDDPVSVFFTSPRGSRIVMDLHPETVIVTENPGVVLVTGAVTIKTIRPDPDPATQSEAGSAGEPFRVFAPGVTVTPRAPGVTVAIGAAGRVIVHLEHGADGVAEVRLQETPPLADGSPDVLFATPERAVEYWPGFPGAEAYQAFPRFANTGSDAFVSGGSGVRDPDMQVPDTPETAVRGKPWFLYRSEWWTQTIAGFMPGILRSEWERFLQIEREFTRIYSEVLFPLQEVLERHYAFQDGNYGRHGVEDTTTPGSGTAHETGSPNDAVSETDAEALYRTALQMDRQLYRLEGILAVARAVYPPGVSPVFSEIHEYSEYLHNAQGVITGRVAEVLYIRILYFEK